MSRPQPKGHHPGRTPRAAGVCANCGSPKGPFHSLGPRLHICPSLGPLSGCKARREALDSERYPLAVAQS